MLQTVRRGMSWPRSTRHPGFLPPQGTPAKVEQLRLGQAGQVRHQFGYGTAVDVGMVGLTEQMMAAGLPV